MNRIYILILFLFITGLTKAQIFDWAVGYGSNFYNSIEEGGIIKVDGNGNSYTYGKFYGAVDFDPGPDSTILNSSNGEIFICKLDVNGNFIWVRQLDLYFYESNVFELKDEYIYIAGSAWDNPNDSIDLDPGPGVYIFNGAQFITKWDTAGIFIWALQYGSYGGVGDIAIDDDHNIYAVGGFNFGIDLDPGPGDYTILATNGDHYITKLDSSGNFIWGKQMGGNGNFVNGILHANRITLDFQNNLIIVGEFINTCDLDPGPAIYNITVPFFSPYILKTDPQGNFLWAHAFSNNGVNFGRSVVTDSIGNIYFTGLFLDVIDFDPGVGVSNLSAITGSYRDIFLCKYSSNGNLIWAKQLIGTNKLEVNDLTIDKDGIIALTGTMKGTVDFDIGPGVFNLTTIFGHTHTFICQYYDDNLIWAGVTQLHTGDDWGNSIAIDLNGNILVTGGYEGLVNFNPGYGTYTLPNNTGDGNAYILKLTKCNYPNLNLVITNPLCPGNTGAVFNSTTGGIPPYTYLWSNGQTTQSIVNLTSGNYYVIVKDDSLCSSVAAFAISVPDPINGNMISTASNLTSPNCNGSVSINPTGGTPPYTISWSSGTTNNLCEGWYTATITDANGCVTTDSVYVDYQCPVISLSMSSTGPLLCAGDTETIIVNATGGSAPYNYLWSSGDTTSGANLSPGFYTVTVTDANSCTATISVNFSQAPSAIITNISSTPTNYNTPNCNGSVAINPSGGTPPYNITWSSGTTTNLCEGWYTATITDANGCVMTDSVYVNLVIGIEELNSAGISIYPNPVNDILIIKSEKEIGEIKIYDVVGKLIYNELFKNNNAEIDVKEFDAGIYFLEAENYRGKFMKW